MKNNSFSKIKDLLNKNGVGFIDCFFRCTGGILELDTEEERKILFSDGKKYLGHIIVKLSDDISGESKDYFFTDIFPKERFGLEVCFTFSEISKENGFSVGKCRIMQCY